MPNPNTSPAPSAAPICTHRAAVRSLGLLIALFSALPASRAEMPAGIQKPDTSTTGKTTQGLVNILTPVADASRATDTPIDMPALRVTTDADDEGFDTSGMGAMEMERDEAPFSNDILASTTAPDDTNSLIETELGQLGAPPPADLSAGQSRLDIRGFPTPRLRNGFTQLGVPDVLNPERNEQITGPLVSVMGRAAPGGITNLVTARPKTKTSGNLGFSFSTLDSQRLFLDSNEVLKAKRAWGRTSLSLSRKGGPEPYTTLRQRSLGQSITRKINRSTSLMVQLDWTDFVSRPAGGIPEYRLTRTGKIQGPWLPLADFHTNGPGTAQRKRLGSIAVQLESQVRKNLAVRATTQWFSRQFTEDRFTRGEYLLDEKVFSGTREPQHSEQPLNTFSGELEATLRLHGLGADHKLLVSAEGSRALLTRFQRALSTSERALLPADLRRFDPAAPNYFHPVYSPDTYTRVLNDRDETTTHQALVISERAAYNKGRLVATAGLRQDWVDLTIEDRKPGVPLPRIDDRSRKLSWHAGANLVVTPGRLLIFANASTAFEPSLRVDSRTGRIQGNETTVGWEAGATGMAFARTVAFTLTGFSFENRNIARKNPLYDNPIYDADNTQPQLVASGAEKFSGGIAELRWRPDPALTLSCRSGYTDARTTSSPDLPEEVGRQLSRLPRANSALSARYAPTAGSLLGGSCSLGLAYIGPHMAYYESLTRARLAYPGYTLLNAGLGWRWKRGAVTHNASLSVRNLLGTDMLARIARPGAGREASLSYTYVF